MNELLFFLHILFIISSVLFALCLGKSALIALLSLQIVVSNLFVTKQIVCFGFHVTCTDVYTIGALLSLNLLQEYFGKEAAKQAIWIAFFSLLFFVIISQIHVKYLPSPYDNMQGVFQQVLATTPRIMFASFAVGFLCQRLDMVIYSFLKKKFSRQAIIFRFSGASLLSQLFDTVFFSFLALYNLVHSMTHIIVLSYLIKVSIIFCMAPFTTFAKRFFRDPIQI